MPQAAVERSVSGPPAPTRAADGRRKAAPRRRTGITTALWFLIGAAVIGGGVVAGFQIRDLRLRRQIEAAEKRAAEAAATDSWVGWRTARDGLASIAAARRTPETRAALARAQATLAYEFGEAPAEALATLRPLVVDSRTAIARVFMALVAGDAAAARKQLELASSETGPVVSYLSGSVNLLLGDAAAALPELQKAYAADARPFYGAAVARALALLDRAAEAQKLLDEALTRNTDHPALVLAKAQLVDGAAAPTDAARAAAQAQLERVVAASTAASPAASPWQAAMARLISARLALHHGQRAEGLAALTKALELDIDEQRVAEQAVRTVLAADLPEVALVAAKRGLAAWPDSISLRLSVALCAFAEGRLTDTLEALPDALIGRDPRAYALRARAKVAGGDVEGARRDLDAVAAAASPELDAARAVTKLAAGEQVTPAATIGHRPARALIEAMAARLSGDGAKAVAILEPVATGALGEERYSVRLELARAYRDAANYPRARVAYQELSATPNPQVRLETAQLLLNDRDPKGAREHIESLLRDIGDKATGLMLVEAMRIRTLTGAADQAEAIAAKAAAAGAPPWMLQREAARIARRREAFPEAVTALNKALDGSKGDLDTLLLACDLVDGAPEAFVAKVTKAVQERLAKQPEQLVAQGKLAIARRDTAKAEEYFAKASHAFMEHPASARRMAQASFGAGALAAGRRDWVMAKLKLATAIELDPSLIDAYLFQAETLAAGRGLAQAVALLRVASEYNPESAVVWQLLARRAEEAGDRKTAAEAAKRAAALTRK